MRTILSIAAATLAVVTAARADIFQWEYVDPADPSQGKRQSTILAPGGAGVDAVPGAILVGRNLTMAYLAKTDLTGADFSTRCYPCSGANLTDADLSQSNLTNVIFSEATLYGADFSDAIVRGASFHYTGFSSAQLYSTASYQDGDLSAITWGSGDFARRSVYDGWDFAGQNLTNSYFKDPQDFSSVSLNGTDFTGADVRGAAFVETSAAINDNLIGPDGHVSGLELKPGQLLIVRDYDGDGPQSWRDAILPIPITIDQHLAIGAGGTLRMVFEADAWDSTLSFATGIPAKLGGTLELTFAKDVNLGSQVGRTFDLFDWTGVNANGDFTVSSPYLWNLSNLYSSGEVTLIAVPEPPALALLVAAIGSFITRRRDTNAMCRRRTANHGK